ncbi:hypothetical protein OB69_13140 [Roseivirga seohaensis subsp. aquiponti]|uniref:Uncharacterized protein n=1 Tax=Roseivirga seohaensis subsp. aquiponti TaxID=1566026 RepID=A0A0L8AJD8_9BACT|nr:OmpH family outer membrane protein [Roseivirga seohaensis]KOF02356.1 hypothetical protein OB69_13140 [Roseivirga seohaensis subsp. aquiponti]
MILKKHLIYIIISIFSLQIKAQTVGTVKADYLQTKSPEYKKFQKLRNVYFDKTYKDLLKKIDSVNLALSKTPDNNKTKKDELSYAKFYYEDLLPQFENDFKISRENKDDFGTTQQYYAAMDGVLSNMVTSLNIDCMFGSNTDLINSFVIYRNPRLDITEIVANNNLQSIDKLPSSETLKIGFIDIMKFENPVSFHDESKDIYFLEKSYEISEPITKLKNRIQGLTLNEVMGNKNEESINELKNELKIQEQIANTKRVALEEEKRTYQAQIKSKRASSNKEHYDKVKSAIKYICELNNIDLVLNTSDFRIISTKTENKYPELTDRILLGLKEGGDITDMVNLKLKENSSGLKVGVEVAKIGKVDIDRLTNHIISNNADFLNFLKKLETQYQGRDYQRASRHHIEKFQYQVYKSLQSEAITLAKSKGYNVLLDLAYFPSTGMYGTHGMRWRMDYIYFHPRNELTKALFEKTKDITFKYQE